MPANMTSQKMQTRQGTQPRVPQSSHSSSSSRAEEAPPNVESPARRTLQKKPPPGAGSGSQTHFRTPSTRSTADTRSMQAKRRLSIRDRSATLGSQSNTTGPPPRANNGNTRRGGSHANNTSTVNPSPSSSRNSNSTFGTSLDSVRGDKQSPSDTGEFLAPINFDDFQNSLMSREPSLSHFPMPGGQTGGENRETDTASKSNSRWNSKPLPEIGRGNRAPPANRQPDNETGSMPPPRAPPPPSKTRRQSFISTTSSTPATSRPPRKSVGPGMPITRNTDNTTTTTKRKPSISRKSRQVDGAPPETTTISNRRENSQPDQNNAAFLDTTRVEKSKSLQPPPRDGNDNFLRPGSISDATPSSPGGGVRTPVGSGTSDAGGQSSSSKRASMMPAHATGLGARTISPTDARRMKRMSLIPQPPPVPRSPTNLDHGSTRPGSSVQSPSMIPRKSVTPSSSRNTPDPNRKSYNSTTPVPPSTPGTNNPARNSNSSFQNRMSQNMSSRLPTPKPRHENASSTEDKDEEDVPPVPAIPKAYESPKVEHERPGLSARKSSLPLELHLQGSSGEEQNSPSPRVNDSEDGGPKSSRHYRTDDTAQSDTRYRSNISMSKKNLQPLKLPPLNLLPLGDPMATKINSLRDREYRPESPPQRQTTAKTPTTPLTASKANFSFHQQNDYTVRPKTQTRSNSSIFTPRAASTMYRSEHSTSALDTFSLHPERTTSPEASTSLPKAAEWNYISSTPSLDAGKSAAGHKLNGPRPQTSSFSPVPDPAKPRHVSYGAFPSSNTPSSPQRKPSIEHKISSTRLRGALEGSSKSSYEQMPPPKLPASATQSTLTTSRRSPTANVNYIHTRRRPSVSVATTSTAPRRNQSISSDQNEASNSSPSTNSEEVENSHHQSPSVFSHAHKLVGGSRSASTSSPKPRPQEGDLDKDDLLAEEEMRKLGSKRKDFESAARELAELRRRASPKERATAAQALKVANLNIFERGEIIDFKDIYFCGTHKAKKHVGDLNSQTGNFGYDDERGDYNIVIGDHIAYRYEIVDVLGKGSFGQVVRCVDHKTGQLVAVKIIRNKKRFHQQALVEVNILQKLKEWDPQHRHSVVNFTQSFYFRGHLCISTELLGMNLYELIKAYDFKGFSTKIIRRFTKQVLSSLMLLRAHNVVHCDLKPENILLSHPMRAEIKVIDFGSSCFENEKVYTYIQSRFYRSPEVILGMSYGMPIDMWSLGCILAELYTGYPIFPGENEQEQLACIMEIFGPPEKHLIDKSTRKKLFFDSQGKPRLTVSSKGRRRKPSSKDLRHALKCDDDAFLDFIARCLRWDPARRLTPTDALNHEFLTGIKPTIRTKSGAVNSSPGPKRHTSNSITSNRPLPDPPVANLKPGAGRTGNSPVKASPSKRLSTMPNTTSTPGAKRSTHASTTSGSALPRVSARSVSGKPDLAAAAAATSLKTRV